MPAEDYNIFNGEVTPSTEKFIWARSFLAKLLKVNKLNAPVERPGGAEGEIPVRVEQHESTGAELYILVSDIPIPADDGELIEYQKCLAGAPVTVWLKEYPEPGSEAE